jgi:hypothetical protein
MNYKWKIAEFNIDANIAGRALEELEAENGSVTPSLVVQAAAPKNAILHRCFEWNNQIAGNKYRESQAGEMLRKLVIINITEDPDKETEVIRAFVNVLNADNERVYVSTLAAMGDNDYRNQVLADAIRDLLNFQKKYQELKELSALFSEIKKLAR